MVDAPFWNRTLLYKQVWGKPLSRVASDYGVSGAALRKVCKKLNVPLPRRGHWSKSAQARPFQAARLPKWRGRMVVRKSKKDSTGQILKTAQLHAKTKVATEHATKDADRLLLVSETERTLRKAPIDYRGIIRAPSNSRCLDLRVSKPSLERALQIASRLLVLLKSAGVPVSIDLHGRATTVARAYSHDIQFAVVEFPSNVAGMQPLINPAEIRGVALFGGSPPGQLRIQVLECAAKGLRKRWSDGEKNRLEDLLPSCVSGFKALGCSLQVMTNSSRAVR